MSLSSFFSQSRQEARTPKKRGGRFVLSATDGAVDREEMRSVLDDRGLSHKAAQDAVNALLASSEAVVDLPFLDSLEALTADLNACRVEVMADAEVASIDAAAALGMAHKQLLQQVKAGDIQARIGDGEVAVMLSEVVLAKARSAEPAPAI